MTAHRGKPARLMSEPLGRLHFWLTLLGAYATFLPMHLAGLAGQPRHYAQLTGIPGPGGSLSPAGHLLATTIPLNRLITYAAIFLAAAQIIFFINLVRSLRHGDAAPTNPWQATTLEWHPSLHPNAEPEASAVVITVHHTPCLYICSPSGDTFVPQWENKITVDLPAESKPE
jgi:cytochrome c oxidase subunit 1